MLKSYYKISTYQAIMLLVLTKLIDAYTYLPIILPPPGNQDVWIVGLGTMLYNGILSLLTLFLLNKYKNLSIIQIGELLLGKVGGKIISLLTAIFLFYHCTYRLALIGYFTRSFMLPDTPLYLIIGATLICCCYSAYKGLSIHGRLAEIITPIILIDIIIVLLLNLRITDFKVFLPILKTTTFKELNFASIVTAITYDQIFLLGLIFPNLKKREEVNKIYIYFLIIITAFHLMIIISTLGVFGVKQALHQSLPYLASLQQISVLKFLQRLEVFSIFSWVIGMYIDLSLSIYLASKITSYVVSVKKFNIFIIPYAILTYIVCNLELFKKNIYIRKMMTYKVKAPLMSVFIIVIPVILIIMYFIRGKSSVDKK